MGSNDIEKIVSSAYAAAIYGDRWQNWLEDVASAIGSAGGLFGVMNRRSLTVEHTIAIFDNAKGWDEYVEGMGRLDPYARHAGTLKGPTLQTCDDFLDRDDPANAEYLTWAEDRFDFFSSMILMNNLGDDLVGGFCFHFPRNTAGRAQQSRDLLAGRHREIVQAMQLGFAHQHLLQDRYWEGLRARDDDRATWLLGETGKVLRLNQAAEALIACGDTMTCRAGRLGCADTGNADRLFGLIRRAVEAGEGGAAPLLRREARPLIASVDPLPRSSRGLIAAEAAALLIVRDPAHRSTVDPGLWRDLFGLTAAESRIADSIQGGQMDEQVATELGLRVSTVRTHIKAVLAKTETRSKAELAALLTRFAAP